MKRPRISLRAALILLTIVGIGCGLVARWLAEAERQRVARTKLAEQGIGCRFDFGEDEKGQMRLAPAAPQWLVDLVGLDALYPVDVDFTQAPNDPAVIRLLHDIKLSGLTAYAGTDGDSILKIVARDASLKRLRLYGGVSDAGLSHLADMPELVELHLHGDTFTGTGLSRLEAPLRSLEIECAAFSDEGLRHVGRFQQLRDLFVVSDTITNTGVHHLASLNQLHTLNLTLAAVTDEGLEAITRLSRLRGLHLEGPQVGARNLSWLAKMDGVIHLTLVCGVTDTTLPQISGLKNLKILYLDGQIRATNAGMSKLRGLSRLEVLNVPSQLLTDESIPAIGDMTSLPTLILNDTSVSDAGLVHLRRMSGLQVLWLANCKITDEGLSRLTAIKNLRELSLENTQITDDGLHVLSRARSLVALNLRGCKVTAAGLVHLRESKTLNDLILGGDQFDDRALNVLRELKHIELLDLRDCPITDEILPTLLSLPKLEILNLRPDQLSIAAVQQLQAAHVTVQTPRD